jgi:hypothetical protein
MAVAPNPDTDPGAPSGGEPTPGWLRTLLGVIGVALVTIALFAWLLPEEDTTKTVSEGSTTAAESTAAPTIPAEEGSTMPGQESGSGTSTTKVEKTTETTTPPASRRSEALVAALFGVGAVLILAGVFANRITSLKFPGGEIALVQAKVAEALAAKTTPRTPEERDKVRAAYLLASQEALAAGVSPGDDYIEEVTSRAIETVGAPGLE